ncbi:polysaccharide pyruvyl transferase family protein [Halomonas sp. GXIMD04776]|uniref:polysaccharide pyruvyl transferase family protein n=1 Tax=Halomonas sp. GXIMD04776 TaxID=3415605 RepID=UPI003CB89176
MKIGVLTYHRVVNLGSVIQAWCVVEIAKKLYPDAQVEVIDYQARKMQFMELRKYVGLRPLRINKRHLEKKKTLDNFVKCCLPISKEACITNSSPKAMTWLKKRNYDMIFVGSDTVWELRHGSYSPEGSNLYFLPGEMKSTKVSISASMDPLGNLTEKQKREQEERIGHLRDFDLLSVRDKVTLKELEKKVGSKRTVLKIPDPTLMNGLEKLLHVTPPFKPASRPVAGVALPRDLSECAHKALNELGYEVWDWNGHSTQYTSRVLSPRFSPQEVLALHAQVDAFVTDRFHGSIFCLIQKTIPVLFFESPKKWPMSNSKGRDLFEMLDLENFVFRERSKLEKTDWLRSMLEDESISKLNIPAKMKKIGFENLEILRIALNDIKEKK